MKKKFLSLLLSLMLTITMVTSMPFSIQGVAENGAPEQNTEVQPPVEVISDAKDVENFVGYSQYKVSDYINDISFAETAGQHDDVNGVCSSCGDLQPAVMITEDNRNDYGFTDYTYVGSYAIGNAGQLKWFANLVNAGSYTASAVLINDIDISNICGESLGVSWTPIGDYSTNNSIAYKGTFDGNRHSINGLYISGKNLNYQGLFGRIDDGKVLNLMVSGNITVTYSNSYSASNIGGICGNIASLGHAKIENCINNCTVSARSNVGGISGCTDDSFVKITNCVNIGTVSGYNGVGAICGKNSAVVTNCYYLTADGKTAIGGINGSDETGRAESRSEAQFMSGEVAMALQANCSVTAWGQLSTDKTPFLTGDDTLTVKKIICKYNDGADSTEIVVFKDKTPAFPQIETEEGTTLAYWAKEDGTPFRITDSFESGIILTPVITYSKLSLISDSDISIDRTNLIITNAAMANGVTVAYYKNNFKNNASFVLIEDARGNALSDTALVGTGCVIKSLSQLDGTTVLDSLTVVIMGDVNGDGLLDDNDYSLLKTNVLTCTLEGAYLTAADIHKDGAIDGFDLYLMNLSNNSVNGKLKYNVTSQQTLTDITNYFGEGTTVYNADGKVVTDSTKLLGTGTKIVYRRNGVTLTQTLVVNG